MKLVAPLASALVLSGCVASAPSLPRLNGSQAVALFQSMCLSAPFNTSANIAAFAKSPDFTQNGPAFVMTDTSITEFTHKTLAVSGGAGTVFGKPSCSIEFTPANGAQKDGVDAAIRLTGIAGAGVSPFGMKGQGFIMLDYKGGKLSVNVDRKTNDLTLSVSKL